jgi:hypothetical protein
MTAYKKPKLNGHTILYKGRRFIAFEISKQFPFESFEDGFQFAIFDGLYDATLAVGVINPNGTYQGELAFSVVEILIPPCETLREFLDIAVKEQEAYFKTCGG